MAMVVVVEGQKLVLVARGERGCVAMGKLFYHQHQSWGPSRAQNTIRELVLPTHSSHYYRYTSPPWALPLAMVDTE